MELAKRPQRKICRPDTASLLHSEIFASFGNLRLQTQSYPSSAQVTRTGAQKRIRRELGVPQAKPADHESMLYMIFFSSSSEVSITPCSHRRANSVYDRTISGKPKTRAALLGRLWIELTRAFMIHRCRGVFAWSASALAGSWAVGLKPSLFPPSSEAASQVQTSRLLLSAKSTDFAIFPFGFERDRDTNSGRGAQLTAQLENVAESELQFNHAFHDKSEK